MKKILFFVGVFGIVTLGYAVSAQEINPMSEREREIANKVVNSVDFYDKVSISFREKYGNLSDREYQVQAKMDFSKGILDEEFVEVFENKGIGEQKAIIYDKSKNKNLVDVNFKENDYFVSQYTVDTDRANKGKSIESRLTKKWFRRNGFESTRFCFTAIYVSRCCLFTTLWCPTFFSL